jgi:uncharacterized protein YecE (DUF72 family)
VAALGDRLGPVLFRCPPTLERDDTLIAAFADDVPPGMLATVQFDHPSWAGMEGLLAERGIALCIADTDEEPYVEGAPLPMHPFAYLRLRRTDYTGDDLRCWADRIRAMLSAERDVHCYFRHEDSGTGPRWASALMALLS